MIEYVIPENPDDRILKKAEESLRAGNLISFPTDTNWVVACDPFNKKGVEKLYRFKKVQQGKHFSVLCDSVSHASRIAIIDDWAFRYIHNKIPGHFTFIFNASKKTMKALKASRSDNEVGIRFSPSLLVDKIISMYGEVLLSTSITPDLMESVDTSSGIYGHQIEELFSSQIAIIIDPGEYKFVGPSTVISLIEKGQVEVIRQGAGSV